MITVNHNLNNRPIGFFDSGVGGLSVYSKFRKILPFENTLYYGDLIHLPYGNKTKEELINYARNILNFYKEKDVKAVVIACNTSSAQAYDIIKNEYEFKIYPIIQSSAKVIASQNINRIGIFATEATVKSKVYTRELHQYNKNLFVKEIACPNWVNIVESGKFQDKTAFDDINRHLEEMLEIKPDKIILGCTHYPYLIPILSKIVSHNIFIDPADIFVEYIKQDLAASGLLKEDNVQPFEDFFVSANPESFMEHAAIFYKLNHSPKICIL